MWVWESDIIHSKTHPYTHPVCVYVHASKGYVNCLHVCRERAKERETKRDRGRGERWRKKMKMNRRKGKEKR